MGRKGASMMLAMGMYQGLSLRQLVLEGGVTESCLPRSEALLRENQRVLRMLRKRISDEQYHSVMDAVLCCFVPFEKPACFAYYEGKGKQLVELYSKKRIAAIDAHLFNCISTLIKAYKEIVEKELWAKGLNHSVTAFDMALEVVGWKG